MILIPVIDLLQGYAVLAHLGHRESYVPLNSPLCANGEVLPLVERLTNDFGCKLVYFADLDAIRGTGDNIGLLTRVAAGFPELQLWLDGGFHTPDDVRNARQRFVMRAVIGSESWLHGGDLPDGEPILSIDMDAAGLRDPSGICSDAAHTPRDVILMNLDRVGSGRGPDLRMLARWQALAPDSRLYAAGGVRDMQDLLRLQAAGAAGVLLASALHHGGLSRRDIQRFSGPRA